VRITPEYARKIPLWILAVTAFSALAGAVAFFTPQVGIILGRVYSSFAPTSLEDEIIAGETRLTFFSGLGGQLILYVVAQTNPLSLIHIRHLGALCLYLSGLFMIFLSGFRGAILSSILYTTLAVFLRDRFLGMVKIALAVIVLISGAILLSFTNINLPQTAQRALCFLPGNWDPEAVDSAKDSSEWRFEMWEIALTSDKYIHNKIFGDGFGFMRADYERGVDMLYGRTSLREGEARQEMFLLDGDFHSGPISGVKVVGYLGLTLLIPLLAIFAKMGYRLINISNGTPYESCCLFICIPIIIHPFVFIFIFGEFKAVLVYIMISVGVMKMLQKSIANLKTVTI
jgi:hypothetical protein